MKTLVAPEAVRPTSERIEYASAATARAELRLRSAVSSWRYELKYLVPRHARARVLADMAPYVEPDGHGDSAGAYVVHSEYFDSPDLACFRAKVDGLPDRFKLRVRTYTTEGSSRPNTIKLEIKERDAERVRKIVTTVDRVHFEKLLPALESFHMPDPVLLASSTSLARFFHVKALGAMRAVASITYLRRAMVPRVDRRCRVTLDEDIMGAAVCGLFDSAVKPAGVSLSDAAVLEIKTPSQVPCWLARLIRKHGLQRCACSKYALAVTRCLGVEA